MHTRTATKETTVTSQLTECIGRNEFLDPVKMIGELRNTLTGLLDLADYQKLALLITSDRCSPHPLLARTVQEAIVAATKEHPGEALHLLNENVLRERVRYLQKNLLPNRRNERRLLYPIKPNPQKEVLRILSEEGIDGFDCASSNEAIMALLQGAGSDELYYNLPKHSPQELRNMLELGTSYVTVDSASVLDQLLEEAEGLPFGQRLEIAVRIAIPNPHASIQMSGKFGVPPEQYDLAEYMLRVIKRQGCRTGVCFHAGSQIEDPEMYRHAIVMATEIARDVGGVNSMNLGGGLPIDYFGALKHSPDDYLRVINEAVDANVNGEVLIGEDPRIIFEFGRFVVAPCVHWASPIHTIEKREGQLHLSYQGGIHNTLNGLPLHGWPLPPASVVAPDGTERMGEKRRVILSGESCNPIDQLDAELPCDLRPGDYLLLGNMGAYTDAYGSFFNGFNLPNYVLYNS